jgi:hypothetical protein
VAPAATSANNTPGVNAPDTGDQTIDNVQVAITKSKHVPIRWNGEETKGLKNGGKFSNINADRAAQAMRTLINEMEADIHLEARTNASRAYGTAATTPFGTAADLSDFAGVLRILEENGAKGRDLQLVVGHAALGNLRGKQSTLFKVNEAGSADMLRNGMTDRVMGLALRHSDAPAVVAVGGGTSYQTNGAIALGATSVPIDTGTGTVLAGDVVTFTGDTNKYVVNTGVAAAGTIVVGRPGIKVTKADNIAMAITAAFTPNVAFGRHAIVLATRAPALPEGGDMAVDVTSITDPITGLTFEVALYKQFLQNVIHIRAAWGTRAIKQDHIALLLG